jgi:hypothetical protein
VRSEEGRRRVELAQLRAQGRGQPARWPRAPSQRQRRCFRYAASLSFRAEAEQPARVHSTEDHLHRAPLFRQWLFLFFPSTKADLGPLVRLSSLVPLHPAKALRSARVRTRRRSLERERVVGGIPCPHHRRGTWRHRTHCPHQSHRRAVQTSTEPHLWPTLALCSQDGLRCGTSS